jgi:hypothetical protein
MASDAGSSNLSCLSCRDRARFDAGGFELKPDEIVEVALQDPDDKTSAAANRLFSIRLRVKQVR